MLLPYAVNTLTNRTPWVNLAILALNVVSYLLVVTGKMPESAIESMVLQDWNPVQLLGYQFLHADFWHLASNMLVLWVFGNAINGIMNQGVYAACYLLFGCAAGALHLAVDTHPAIGASGAISGLTGFYLAVYPTNAVSCWWMFGFHWSTIEITGYWLILFWIAADLFFAIGGSSNIAHWAHLGGTVAGFCGGLLCLRLGLVDRFDYDHPTLPELITRQRD